MKTPEVTLGLLAFVQLVAAQNACLALTTLFPTCAFPCVTSAGSQVGCTVSTDLACRCDPVRSRSIQNLAVGCVIAACTKSGELASALAAGPKICSCVATAVPDVTTTSEVPAETTTDVTTTTEAAETSTETASTSEETTVPITSTTTADAGTTTETATTETQPQDTTTETEPPQDTTTETEPPQDTTTETEPPADTTTETEIESTTTQGNPGGSTCQPGTTEDCGPVATTAIPSCAHACFSSAAPSIGCGVDDYACQCEAEAQASLSQILVPCVITACAAGDLPGIITGASSVCACATAAPVAGDCSTTDDGSVTVTATDTATETNPPTDTQSTATETATATETGGQTTTCPDATTADCGPVATTAVPSCAHACFSSAAPNVGCAVDDYACQCESDAQASLSQLLIPCVATACAGSDLPAVITGASSVCACASADPTGGCSTGVPPTGGDSTTTAVETTATETSGGGGGGGDTTTCADATTSDCGPIATSAVPSCAHACFSSAAPGVGCAVDDYACQCEDTAQSSLSQLLIPCVATACSGGDLAGVITGASSVCACATAPPSGGNCGGGGGGGDATTTDDTYNPPTTTGGSGGGGGGGGSTCVPGTITSADCGPIATSAVPSCAHACFSSAAPGVGCAVDDYACQCEEDAQASLSQLLVPCVATACSGGDLAAVITGASSVCACATAPVEGGDGDCETGGGGGGGGGEPTKTGGTYNPPTSAGGGGGGSTCVPGTITSADCGPIATSAVPSCAHACFSSAAPGVGCAVDDYACQCEEEAQASLSQLLVPCVATACSGGDLAGVIAGASSVCACATAPPSGGDGDCESGGGGGGGSEPTKTGGSGYPSEPAEGSTCVPGTITAADCGPVATSAVPSCAHACFSSAAPNVGCAVDDYACQCESEAQASLSQLLVPCVATACDSDQLAAVITGASSVCACATAPASGGSGDCEGSGGGGGGGGDEPTQTGGSGYPSEPDEGSTCVAGSVTAADCGPVATSAVPSCAHACFSSAAPDVGCAVDDYACQCQADTQESLSHLLVPCVATACDSDELAAVITGASSVCACATAPASGGSSDCEGSGGSGGSGNEGGVTTCVTVTKSGSDGEITKSSSCYRASGGQTFTTQPATTGESSSNGSGSGDESESEAAAPTETGPLVVEGRAARYDIGIVAGVFGAFWVAAVAL